MHSEITLPPNAPKEYADRATLWNAVELSEKGQKSQLARMLKASLPNEWSYELAEEVVRENTFSIEDKCTLDKIKNNHEIVIGYPVQYSNIPKILRDYVMQINTFGKGKRFLLLQQWDFSAVTVQEY